MRVVLYQIEKRYTFTNLKVDAIFVSNRVLVNVLLIINSFWSG
jgi:hypothetical protein